MVSYRLLIHFMSLGSTVFKMIIYGHENVPTFDDTANYLSLKRDTLELSSKRLITFTY